jgi:predicted dehydrogenase
MGRRHLQAIQMSGMEITAICDLDVSAIAQAVQLCPSPPQTYNSWQALIEQEAGRIDLMVVATNGPSHAEISQGAARSGIPYILCEKPMATSGQHARDMVKVCEESGSRLAVNLSRRYMDRYIRLKQALKKGVIGEIHHVNIVVGAGGLGCVGTHFFDLVAWLADAQATWVIGSLDSNPEPNPRGAQFFDPGGRGIVGYTNCMTAVFELSGDVPVMAQGQIVGTHGLVEFNELSPPPAGRVEVFARPKKHWSDLKTSFVQPKQIDFEPGEPPDVLPAVMACLQDLVGDYRENTAVGGIAAVDIVMAFHLSAQRDWQKVRLPLAGADLLLDVPIT